MMNPDVDGSSGYGHSAERAALDAVLRSGVCSRAPNLERILVYICRKRLEGATEIREYDIAVDALGRRSDFDPTVDSIVRVAAHQLRKRLKHFYETDGAAEPVQIVLPSGRYIPQFVKRTVPPPEDHPSVAPLDEPPAVGGVPKPARTGKAGWVVAGLAVLAVACAAILAVQSRSSQSRGSSLASPAAVNSVAAPKGVARNVRILAGWSGVKYVDRMGNEWSPDEHFEGGTARTSNVRPIFRTSDPFLFQSRREGSFSYRIPAPSGTYRLHLYFAETVFGPQNIAGGADGARIFDVAVNGRPVLRALDVLSDAGGSNIAVEKILQDVSPGQDGYVKVDFLPNRGAAPMLNALALVSAVPGVRQALRIRCRDTSYTDKQGIFWAADNYYMGGSTVERAEPVSGIADPEILRGERFGNFTYAVPVAPGAYTVKLWFSETWWGPQRPFGGGRGSRIFDVYCNGTVLLKELDIFKEAGGGYRALVKSFRGLRPNAQGKLALAFVPAGASYACLNAIEILPNGDEYPRPR